MANLSKPITHGLLAVASVGAILTLSESAKAFTYGQWQTDPTLTIVSGDKTFSNFSFSNSNFEATDTVTVQRVGDFYQLTYNAIPGADSNPLTVSGSMSYTVTIGQNFTNVLDLAGTSLNGSNLGGSFAKTLTATGLSPGTINDSQTGVFASNLKTTTVTAAWTVTGSAFISQVSDQYKQNPVEPNPVPEPLTMLGTGVVLGALPVLKKEYAKRKKKKDGNA
jgi:hypothetical protein